MARRLFFLALLSALLLVPLRGSAQQSVPRQGRQDLPATNGPRQLTFNLIIARELRVRYPQEQLFVNQVVQSVEQDGSFSQPFVLAVVRHAQRRNIVFPFPYFQAMMVRIAESKGVSLRPTVLYGG